jgi:hypothetical protein
VGWWPTAIILKVMEMLRRVWAEISYLSCDESTVHGNVSCIILPPTLRSKKWFLPSSGFLTENLYAFQISPILVSVYLHKHQQDLIRIQAVFRNGVLYYEK